MHRSTHPARRRTRTALHVTPIAAAVAAVLSTGLAQAQQAAPAEGATQTVTVTGIRRGIESAISVKKNAEGVVEAISAEDIGKLPDTTIAESLARLPGVTTQRDRNGNATTINIRGLGPDFNGYLLNGREQTTTGDSRGVDLSVYPAELIGGATVYKTGDAALMAAGLAGTIDNKLIDPLSFGSRVVAGSYSKTKSGVGLPVEGDGSRYSLTYVDQFMDRTLGLAIGFVSAKGDSSSLNNGGWGSTVNATLANGTVVPGVNIPFGGGIDIGTDVNKDERTGLAAILSYRPNKNFQSQLDIYTAKIKTAKKRNFLKAGTNGANITNATVVDGTATSGTYAMAPNSLIIYGENIFDDDKIDSLGWKNTLKFGDGWTASVDLSQNKAKRIQKDIEVYAGINTPDTLSFTYAPGGVPQLTVGNPGAYTDPATLQVRDQSGWSGVNYTTGPFAGQTVPQAGYNKGPTITDKMNALRFDLRKDLGISIFTDVQFGANFSKRTKDRVTDEGVILSTGNGGYDRIPYPAGSYVFSNIGGTGINALTFDPTETLWPGATVLRKYNDDILSKTWGVEEKVTTGYVKLNLDTTVAGIPLTGNVGAQLVKTDQSSLGYRAEVGSGVTLNNPAGSLSRDGVSYNDFLPSLNLNGDLGGGNILRFALGKQIARPNLTDMRNSFAASVNNDAPADSFIRGRFVGSAGNPYLKPFKATALDLSYEKYFGNRAYLSAAAFYKKLDTYITPATVVGYDFTTYAQQLGLAIPAKGPLGVFTTTANGTGGNVKGIELAVSLPLNLATSMLDGFGVQGSYSNTTSSVSLSNLLGLNPSQQVPLDGPTIQLPGLSKTNTKLMVYYEKSGFSAFVAQNKRSSYIGSVSNSTVGGYPALVRIDPQTWLSAQVGYEVQSGMFKGLGVRLEGNNLNKPVYREFDGANTRQTETGASYGLKLTYKLQ